VAGAVGQQFGIAAQQFEPQGRFPAQPPQPLALRTGTADANAREQSILDIAVRVLPITGTDIMAALGVPPGLQVGVFLARARSLYELAPCGKEELLARLRSDIPGEMGAGGEGKQDTADR
jgi:hypothetical protein